MAGSAKKELLTILRLDDVDFKTGLDKSQKQLLGFSAAIGAVGVAMVAVAKQTADYEVETLKAARSAGQSVETFSAMRYVADVAGVSMEDLSKATRKLIEPTDDAVLKLKAFGISVRDSSGHMKSQAALMAELSKKYQELPTAADRANLAVAAFGEDGAKMTSVLAQNFSLLTAEAQKMGLIVTKQAADSAQKFNTDVEKLSGSMLGLRNQIGNAIISFINQTGIIQKAAEVVQKFTGWWMGLSDNTRTIIVGMGFAAAAIGVVVTALLGIVAVAPTVTAAVTAMSGGLNIVLLAVVAFAAEVTAAVTYIALNFKKFESFFAPAIKAVRELKATFQPLLDMFSNFGDSLSGLSVLTRLKDSLKDVDVFASGIKLALAAPIAGFLILAAAVRTVINIWKTGIAVAIDFAKVLFNLNPAVIAVKGAQAFEDMKAAAKDAMSQLTDFAKSETAIVKQAASGIGSTYADVLTKETKKAETDLKKAAEDAPKKIEVKDPFAGISNSIFDMYQGLNKAADSSQNFAQRIEGAKKVLQGFGQLLVDVAKSMEALAQVRLTNLKQQLESQLGLYKAVNQKELSDFTSRIDAELAEIQRQHDQIQKEEADHQAKLKQIQDQYAADRKKQLDAELEGEFARLNAVYQLQLATINATTQTAMEKEAQKSQAAADLEDKKNQLILQSQQRLAKDVEDQKTKDQIAEEQRAAAKQKREDDLAARQKELEDQKAAAAEAASKREADAAKLKSLIEWQAGKQAFEAGKKANILQATVGMLMSALAIQQAFAMIVGQAGIPGIPIGAAFAATAGALTLIAGTAAISAAQSAQYPPPPVFAAGGIATGPSIFGEAGPMGNIAGFKGRELAIPAKRPGGDFSSLQTAVAESLVSKVPGGPGGMTFNGDFIFQNTFGPRDDEQDIMDMMGDQFLEKVKSAVPA